MCAPKHASWHICGPTTKWSSQQHKICMLQSMPADIYCGPATSGPANSHKIYVLLQACQPTYMWAHYKRSSQQHKIYAHSKHSSWHICGPAMSDPANSDKIYGHFQIPHIKHASQQPLNIMCYMHAGQHSAPTASVPADQWVIYVCYTHATIKTDMAWGHQWYLPATSMPPCHIPLPYRSCLKPCYYSWQFLPNHTSHSVIPITTSLPPTMPGVSVNINPLWLCMKPWLFWFNMFYSAQDINNNKKIHVFEITFFRHLNWVFMCGNG